MKEFLKSLWTNESGQGLTEYAVIIALVSIALITVLFFFRQAIANVFNNIRGTLETVNPTQAST